MQWFRQEGNYIVFYENGFWGEKEVKRIHIEKWYEMHPEKRPGYKSSDLNDPIDLQKDEQINQGGTKAVPKSDTATASNDKEEFAPTSGDQTQVGAAHSVGAESNKRYVASAKLQAINEDAVDADTKSELEARIEQMLSTHKANRQEINRLVFESVSAMTAGEDYEHQLASKKGLRRFFGDITGSNKKLQDKINSSRGVAQYAAQMTLQKIAEQNLMSFELIAAINNKLSVSILAVENEINEIYKHLLQFFKQSRNDVLQLENRVDRLERNVNLLNWQNSIEYQMFDGIEYSELGDVAKMVCMIRDFYDITKGQWTTSDLLLLKVAMGTIGIAPRAKVSYSDFVITIIHDGRLKQRLLGGKLIQRLPERYLIPLCAVKKYELFTNEEQYIVSTLLESLHENGIAVRPEALAEKMTFKYLQQEAQVDLKICVEAFDLMLELLFDMQQAEEEGLFMPICDKTEGVDNTNIALERKYQYAAELFKNCELKEACPLLEELSDCGYSRANALLYWIYTDGFPGGEPNEEKAKAYAVKGYQAGDVVSALQYALSYVPSQDETEEVAKKYKPALKELAQSGDIFAGYMLGICYLNDTDEPHDYIIAIRYLLEATEKKFYRAFHGMALRYWNGDGVDEDLDRALKWAKGAMAFEKYADAYYIAARIYEEQNMLECAIPLYIKAAELGSIEAYGDVSFIYADEEYAKIAGIKVDIARALDYAAKGANLGDSHAQYALGWHYLQGIGVPPNRAKARSLLELAAQGGDSAAENLLHKEFGL